MSNRYSKKKKQEEVKIENKNHKIIGKLIVITLAILMIITYSADFFRMF